MDIEIAIELGACLKCSHSEMFPKINQSHSLNVQFNFRFGVGFNTQFL